MRPTKLFTAKTLGIAALAFTTTSCDDNTGGAGGASSSTGSKTTTTTGSMTTSNMTSSSTGGTPPPPALGPQVDRFGRPAINTALNHAFDPDKTIKDAAKDDWNGNGTTSNWVGLFGTEVQSNLAILDALDSTEATSGCGNQLLAKPAVNGVVPADRYAPLGGILAMDLLWVNTAASASTTYLAVEAGIATDGGGRTLTMDVIDVSYSVLAAGDLTMSIADGIAADADTQGATFPYLAPPHM